MLLSLLNSNFSLESREFTPYLCSNPSVKFHAFSVFLTNDVYGTFAIATPVISPYESNIGVAIHVSEPASDVSLKLRPVTWSRNGFITSPLTTQYFEFVISEYSVPIIN